jgi:hypothetical protein
MAENEQKYKQFLRLLSALFHKDNSVRSAAKVSLHKSFFLRFVKCFIFDMIVDIH